MARPGRLYRRQPGRIRGGGIHEAASWAADAAQLSAARLGLWKWGAARAGGRNEILGPSLVERRTRRPRRHRVGCRRHYRDQLDGRVPVIFVYGLSPLGPGNLGVDCERVGTAAVVVERRRRAGRIHHFGPGRGVYRCSVVRRFLEDHGRAAGPFEPQVGRARGERTRIGEDGGTGRGRRRRRCGCGCGLVGYFLTGGIIGVARCCGRPPAVAHDDSMVDFFFSNAVLICVVTAGSLVEWSRGWARGSLRGAVGGLRRFQNLDQAVRTLCCAQAMLWRPPSRNGNSACQMKRQTKRECDGYRNLGNYRIPKPALRYRTNLRHPRLDNINHIITSRDTVLVCSSSFCFLHRNPSRTSCNQRLVTLGHSRRMMHNRPTHGLTNLYANTQASA